LRAVFIVGLGLGLEIGLELVSDWLVVMHTYFDVLLVVTLPGEIYGGFTNSRTVTVNLWCALQ